MFKSVTYGFVLLSALFLASGIALADNTPMIDQVYKAAQAGRLDDAQRMMDRVLKEHPNSAKAHFVDAEILVRQGQTGKAEAELNNAERLNPGLSFANPQAVQDIKNRIAMTHHVSQTNAGGYQAMQSNGFPWGLIFLGLGVIALIVFVMRALNARNAAMFPGSYQGGVQNNSASPVPMQLYGGGMAPMASGGGIGSGIMGGLATGAAVGVGMVAGEALAHRFMDGGRSAADNNNNNNNNVSPVADNWGNSSNDMGGSDFGIANNSSWDDNSNIADSGSDVGGGDWS